MLGPVGLFANQMNRSPRTISASRLSFHGCGLLRPRQHFKQRTPGKGSRVEELKNYSHASNAFVAASRIADKKR
jgi:hypothetical protein